MSYASIASHNIPEGEMPQPDQNLADGHFAGETHADSHLDHKINVLPAGSDPEHPVIENEPVERPEPIAIHPVPVYEPSTSSSAPKPAPAPHKEDVHIPESGAEWEKEAEEAKEEVKEKAKDTKEDVKEKAKDTKETVETKAAETSKDVKEKAAETSKDVQQKAGEIKEDVSKKAGEVKKDASKKAEELEKAAEKKGEELKAAGKDLKKKAKAEIQEAEDKLAPYWEKTKDVVLRPGTLGGLMGVVNVGILGTMGYFAYTRRDQPWDRRIVGGAVASTLALFGAEGYVTESYLSTPEGREEAERAKREGSRAYLQAREVVLRPGVAGGLAGVFNLAVIGTVGYFSYKHWNNIWDPRMVTAVGTGLIALSGVEGYAGRVYADKELPRR